MDGMASKAQPKEAKRYRMDKLMSQSVTTLICKTCKGAYLRCINIYKIKNGKMHELTVMVIFFFFFFSSGIYELQICVCKCSGVYPIIKVKQEPKNVELNSI